MSVYSQLYGKKMPVLWLQLLDISISSQIIENNKLVIYYPNREVIQSENQDKTPFVDLDQSFNISQRSYQFHLNPVYNMKYSIGNQKYVHFHVKFVYFLNISQSCEGGGAGGPDSEILAKMWFLDLFKWTTNGPGLIVHVQSEYPHPPHWEK